MLGQVVVDVLPRDTGDDPAQHVGIDRAVAERLAMPALVPHRLQVFEIAARPRVVLGLGQRAAGRRVLPHFRFRVRVILAEFQARGHVEHLAHGGVAKCGFGQFRHILGHGLARIELAFCHQRRAQGAHHGLRHGHGAVLAAFLEHAKITFIHDAAPVQHDDAVRVVGAQRLLPAHRFLRPQRGKAQAVDILAQRAFQGHGRPQAARHVHRRHQLAEVRHAPAQLREVEIAAIVEADDLVGRRRRAHHPLQGGRIAGGGRQRRRRLGRVGAGGQRQAGGGQGQAFHAGKIVHAMLSLINRILNKATPRSPASPSRFWPGHSPAGSRPTARTRH